ncbi:MAG: hypothetical protein EXS31_03510 [Pedosphaera sp.]|nr:hypothetical protein [Pedosphaera sp.]
MTSLLSVSGQKLHLEIEPVWRAAPLSFGREVSGWQGKRLSISRLDGLLSQLAIQRVDGTWQESDKWQVFLCAKTGRLTAVADGLPAEEFKAIRFRVGLDSTTDASLPEQWPAGHSLNPDVCGLHWGWSSGYVFLAIEGHWTSASGKISGFSYHLAGPVKPMWVELPAKFSGAQPTTLRLAMDVAEILSDGKILHESSSTHSREGDTLASELKDRVPRSFRVASVRKDLYQLPNVAEPVPQSPPEGATPLRLTISDRLPKVKLPSDNPLTVEGVELGRRLFHDSRLSRNDTLSSEILTCREKRKGVRGRRKSLRCGG